VQELEGPAHGLGRGLIGRVPIAQPHEAGGGQGSRLGDPDGFECEIPVHVVASP
jgi:hypothetical protein